MAKGKRIMAKVHALRTEFICPDTKEECYKNMLDKKEKENTGKAEMEFKRSIPGCFEGSAYGLLFAFAIWLFSTLFNTNIGFKIFIMIAIPAAIIGYLLNLLCEFLFYRDKKKEFAKYMALSENEKIDYLRGKYWYSDRIKNIDNFFRVKDKSIYALTGAKKGSYREIHIKFFNETGDACSADIYNPDYLQSKDIDTDLQFTMDGYGNVQIRKKIELVED